MADFESDDLLKDFLSENDEIVQNVEQDLLALEDRPDPEVLNRIFRGMHTIKGTSGFFGFDQLVTLAHRAEDLLNQLRKGELPVTRRVTDSLLKANDQVRAMLADIRSGSAVTYDLTPLLAMLETCSSASEDDCLKDQRPSQEAAAAPEASQPAPDETRPQLQSRDSETMRVEVRKLDYLVNLVGELVLERNRMMRLTQDIAGKLHGSAELGEALAGSSARLSFITDELQNASLRTRMVPIETVFRKLPRLVRELSHSIGKEVELRISGQDTEIDKTMVEHLNDPLVHILRNSLDHGLETAEQRKAAGKPASGLIRVDATQSGDQIVVSIHDDGRGIDPEKIKRKAVERGFCSEEQAAALSRREVLDILFQPGFSTAERVNNLSGRGVGMDVVRTNLRHINGSVEIDSVVGQGTTIVLRVPLTMAILPVLLVEVSDEVYAIPLRAVLETVRLERSFVHRVEGGEVLVLRDATVPLMRLADLIEAPSPADASRAVILSVNDMRVALAVDDLIGQESTVIKPLASMLRDSPYVAGATITGDGRVRLVLDPANLINRPSRHLGVQ